MPRRNLGCRTDTRRLVGPKGLSWRRRHFEPSTSAVFLRLRVSPALRKIVIPHGQQTRAMPKASGALNGVVLSSSLARCRRRLLVDYGPTGRRRSGPTGLNSHATTIFNVFHESGMKYRTVPNSRLSNRHEAIRETASLTREDPQQIRFRDYPYHLPPLHHHNCRMILQES